MDNIKRQKIVERDTFTFEEKEYIALKSDHKCCHCGRKVYFGYGATVEHFIPLSKGGTNRDINLILLCKDCNEKKGNLIYSPADYIEYLNNEDFKKLEDYFMHYIKSFEFVNRDNLLSCDRYKIYIQPFDTDIYVKKKKTKRESIKNTLTLWVKRATYDNVDEIIDYFIKYLNKRNCLDSEEAARLNILFWMRFGCIYYLEQNNEIKCILTITVTKSNGNVLAQNSEVDYFLNMNIFNYYDNQKSLACAHAFCHSIYNAVLVEQELDQLPIKINSLKQDLTLSFSAFSEKLNFDSIHSSGRFNFIFKMIYHGKKVEELKPTKEDEKLQNFFKKFTDINESRIDSWFKAHKEETYDWMINEISLPIYNEDENVT